MMVIAYLISCLALAASAFATTRATDGSVSDINAKITASSPGDIVTIPSGAFTWGAGGEYVELNKAITLQGAGKASTTVTQSSATSSYGAIRISAGATVRGFRVNQYAYATIFLVIAGADNFRFTDLDLRGSTAGGMLWDINESYGLVDHCEIEWYKESIIVRGKSNAWSTAHTMGTENAVYFEDNAFSNDASDQGYIDSNINGKLVARFNTIAGNAKFDAHGTHSNGGNSSRQIEVYHNSWTSTGTAAAASILLTAELRGGTGMVFNNRGADGTFYGRGMIKLQDYCVSEGETTSYPVIHSGGSSTQQVGAGNSGAATEPIYIWRNTRDASNAYIYAQSLDNTTPTQIGADRDFFYEPQHWAGGAVPGSGSVFDTFDGSTGVGYGTAAAMAAITPTTTGVGFWVTNEGSWRSGYAGTSGRLYRWTGSAWSLYYTPYTYPHPLQGDGTVSVADAAIQAGLSPYNWRTSGASYIQTVNAGAYLKVNFSGTSFGATFDVSAMSGASMASTDYPCIKWSVDGGSFSAIRQLTSSDTLITLTSGLSDTTHSIKIVVTQFDDGAGTDRWGGTSSVKITSFKTDAGKTVSAATLGSGGYALYFGDSITEGAVSLAGYTTSYATIGDGSRTWASIIADDFDCEYGSVGFSGQSWTTGVENVPGLPTSYTSILSGVGRTFSPTPNYVVINMGTNGYTTGTIVYDFLVALRASLGSSPYINLLVPFNKASYSDILAGYNTYIAAYPSDHIVFLYYGDTSYGTVLANNNGDGVHPNIAGHVALAALVEPDIQRTLLGAATPTASPAAGTFASAQSVTLSTSTSGATIYYTTNGTTPTTGSATYSSAISIAATTTLKAIAVKSGLTDSSVFSGKYTIGGGGGGTVGLIATTATVNRLILQ